MAEENKALVKSSIALTRFDPKARKELVVRGLIALSGVKIEVFIVDDHKVVRNGIREMLIAEGDFTIIGEAEDGVEALEKLESLSPDILLTNIKMPKMDGLELTRRVTQKYSSCKVILLTLYDEYLTNAMEAGARGYLLKDIRRKELAQAIRHVHSGQVVISEGVKALP
ncbi:MAG: hypothetical protein A2Z28_01235 [Chloroflexi bacterium RBG_16_51_9]|nr:MAG: hypothetical protein A2Z28_01235 [Chloroflexi bacterium RBG_16_51_9]